MVSSSDSLYVTNTFQENAGTLRRYKCQQLPPYIILNFKRFTKNIFVEEKNPTIVNFPLRGLDFRECTFLSTRRIGTHSPWPWRARSGRPAKPSTYCIRSRRQRHPRIYSWNNAG